MIEILITLLLNALLILGFRNAFSPDHILWPVNQWFVERFVNTRWMILNKPLFNCMPCMASFYGLIGLSYLCATISIYALFLYPLWVLCLSGLLIVIKS